MNKAVRSRVRSRAHGRCEYCLLPETAVNVPFHIEHIRARQHGGSDEPSNLALACDRCNLAKGPNLTGVDPESGEVVALFHPRREAWSDHFRLDGSQVVGLTPGGRASVQLLQMNTPRRVRMRRKLMAADGW